MGWKIVRDGLQEYGVSGEYRTSRSPKTALVKKLLEEVGEFVELLEPEELYDVLDVVYELIHISDPTGEAGWTHRNKVDKLGKFSKHIEWKPELKVPELDTR